MSSLKKYIELNDKWGSLKFHGKENTAEEEELLAEMDFVWYKLTDAEIQSIKDSRG